MTADLPMAVQNSRRPARSTLFLRGIENRLDAARSAEAGNPREYPSHARGTTSIKIEKQSSFHYTARPFCCSEAVRRPDFSRSGTSDPEAPRAESGMVEASGQPDSRHPGPTGRTDSNGWRREPYMAGPCPV